MPEVAKQPAPGADRRQAKLDRVVGRQTGRAIKGFDVTLYPGDYGTDRCELERKCLRKAGHAGACWPNGRVGEASR